MIELVNVHKSFKDKKVLQGVDLVVPEHKIFGFVGVNGSGKTTTMKIILGLLQRDEGEVYVNGEPVIYGNTSTNRIIGFLPDVPEFYNYMTCREYLHFSGEVCEMEKEDYIERTEELLNMVGLSDEKHKIKGFSRGMKQRLGIAQAMLHRPKILICDEPTSALDPIGRKDVLDILTRTVEQEDTTVLFSTHILSDVEHVCDELALLNRGKICYSGSIKELKNKYSNRGYIIELADRTLERPNGSEEDMRKEISGLLENGVSFKKAELIEPSLESIFMEVVSK